VSFTIDLWLAGRLKRFLGYYKGKHVGKGKLHTKDHQIVMHHTSIMVMTAIVEVALEQTLALAVVVD
jgi:hypothetical protein